MATALDQLEGLTRVMGAISGTKGKSRTKGTTTSTQKSDMTEEGMDRVLNKILAGPGGVKDISGAARGAGLYDSTTEAQLLNDLAARASGELEQRRAGTTTTTQTDQTQTFEQPGMGGNMAKTLGMMAIGRPLLGGISEFMGGGSFLEGAGLGRLNDLLGGGGSAVAGASPASLQAAGISTAPLASMSGVTPTSSFNLGGALGTGAASAGNLFSGLGTGGIDLSNIVAAPGLDLGATLGSVGNIATAAPGFALSGIPGVGNLFSGLLGGMDPSDMGPLSLFGPGLGGMLAGGPVGALMGIVMNILGGALGGLSIVCTALVNRGLLDKEEYAKGQEYLKTLNPYTYQGYLHLFSKPADKISEGNKFWTTVCRPFAVQRTSLIAEKYGWKRWVRYPLGTVTKVVGEPLCWAVGKYINYKETSRFQKSLVI